MNNWFKGSYKTDGSIYDYRCVWSRDNAGIRWEAVVDDGSIDGAAGSIGQATSESELLQVISSCVEAEIDRHRQKTVSA